ncbi:MAG: nitroreductase [Parabacteroides sp.]|nr:nitroreductase [Parabacteroides sp.]
MNETINSIKNRRSIRKYQEKQISEEALQLILEAATYAPSGSNNQSWIFTAIQNREVLQTLNRMVRHAFLEMELAENEYPAKIAAKKLAQSENYNFYYNAPTLIIASNVPNYANAMADCSCALQNIFLTAHSLGLGSCWINQLRWLNDHTGIRSYLASLGLTEERIICGASAIGFIEGNPPIVKARKENTIQVIK